MKLMTRLLLIIYLATASPWLVTSRADELSLAQPPVSCIENLILRQDSDEYKSQLAQLQTIKDRGNEDYQLAWLNTQAAVGADEKIQLIYDSSERYGMSPDVLAGSLLQEQNLQDAGLAVDFGNYACGNGQLNVGDWCRWASSADSDTQAKIAWPAELFQSYQKLNPGVDICSDDFLDPSFAKPFHDIAMDRMHQIDPQAPEYMLDPKYVTQPAPVTFDEAAPTILKVSQALAPVSDPASALQLRYALTKNFAENCSDHRYGIPALAHELWSIFQTLPNWLKNAQHYSPGEPRYPVCAHAIKSDAYPLHTGWLIADSIYNAGPEILPGILKYKSKMKIAPKDFGPQQLVNAINYSLSQRNAGISRIGKQEARSHIHDLIQLLTAPGQTIVK